jgi:hypothetical protein
MALWKTVGRLPDLQARVAHVSSIPERMLDNLQVHSQFSTMPGTAIAESFFFLNLKNKEQPPVGMNTPMKMPGAPGVWRAINNISAGTPSSKVIINAMTL